MNSVFPLILGGIWTLPLITPAIGQQRYIVSPNDEVIRLAPGDAAQRMVRQGTRPSETQSCSNKFHFGFDYWQSNGSFGARHEDVLGEWFVAKATGTIDTIFWTMSDNVASDSTVYLRVHRSFIGPDYGPGIRPGPYDPPCQQWGYWVNTNNPDGGITAFPEDATDTTWQSTIMGSPEPSTPLIGEQLWGATGFPAAVKPGETISVPMDAWTGPIPVTTGDQFFISLEVRGEDSSWNYFRGAQFLVTTSDEDYPSRLWKYYAHGGEGNDCGTIPSDSLESGWTARGGYSGDSTVVFMLNLWYSTTVTENVPPLIYGDPSLYTTFDTAARTVSLTIEDCNPANPAGAGVAGAILRYSVDGDPRPDIPLNDAGADVFNASIPGQPAGSSVTYRTIAWDFDGDTGTSPAWSYSVVPYGTVWYSIDTGYVCNVRDISSTGTDVPPSGFFLPPTAGANALATDDGTAGPIDMGSSFTLFGKQFRYAWIGVNGAMALSESPTDTQDVNANGKWLPTGSSLPWELPGAQKQGRGTPSTAELMPGMYIAPLGANHILADSIGTYGRILHGDGGDSCQFIVQWDSIGIIDDINGVVPVINTFRAILNRCTGSVEFQYESIDYAGGSESVILSGMQASPEVVSTPNPGYVFLNRLGYPFETRPYGGYCVRFFPAAGMVVDDGWSLVSLPVAPRNGDFRTSALFPELGSRMYSYPYGAAPPETVKPGTGYWVKTATTSKIGHAPGALFHDLLVSVHDGWNLIGGPSGIVSTGSIVPTGSAVSSLFLGYGTGGYQSAAFLEPGDGYWVKVAGNGTLGMNSWGSAPLARPGRLEAAEVSGFNAITFADARGRSQTLYLAGADRIRRDPGLFELPPPPPGQSFDVRFASGKWVEPFPGDHGAASDLPVAIRGAAFPVTVRWEIRQDAPGGSAFVLAAPGDPAGIPMEGTGSAVFADPKVEMLTISLRSGGAVPAGFSLEDNYPNPFNPGTVIRYTVPRAVFVTLKVFNMIGEEVTTLVAEELAPGGHSAEWRPDGLPSGIYFCRLTAGEFTGTKKLVFMK